MCYKGFQSYRGLSSSRAQRFSGSLPKTRGGKVLNEDFLPAQHQPHYQVEDIEKIVDISDAKNHISIDRKRTGKRQHGNFQKILDVEFVQPCAPLHLLYRVRRWNLERNKLTRNSVSETHACLRKMYLGKARRLAALPKNWCTADC